MSASAPLGQEVRTWLRRGALGDERAPSLALMAAFTFIFLLNNGYQFAGADLPLYLPYVLRYFDPSLYSDPDYFMQFARHLHTTLWLALSPVIRLCGWEWPLFLLYLLAVFFVQRSIWSLAHYLTGDARAAWLVVVFCLLIPRVGGTATYLFSTNAANRFIALPFLLFGLRRFWEERYLACAILLGLAAHIHLLATLFMLFIFVVSLALNASELLLSRTEQGGWRPRQDVLRRLAIAGAVWTLIASPIIVWVLLTLDRPLPEGFTHDEWFEVLRARTPYVFLSSWGNHQWQLMLFFGALFVAGLRQFAADRMLRRVAPVAVALCLLLLAQYVTVDILQWQLFCGLQLSRSYRFLILLALIGAARTLTARADDTSAWGAALTGAILLAGLVWLETLTLPFIGVFLLFLLAAAEPLAGGERFRALSCCLLGLFGVLLLLQFVPLAEFEWGSAGRRAFDPYVVGFVINIFGLLAAFMYAERIRWPGARRAARAAALLLIGCVIWFWRLPLEERYRPNPLLFWPDLLATAGTCWQTPEVDSMTPFHHWRETTDLPGKGLERPWFRLQLWVRDNTPPDAVFFTPYYIKGFRNFSARKTFGEVKDGSQSLFDAGYALAWRERMRALGNWPLVGRSELPERYRQIPPARWRELSEQHGVDYLISDGEVDLPFAKLHQEANFGLWRISPEDN
ncbi:DUF6798 domain-containing protein [Candidatus Sumerlaeota bacterium]